MRNIIQILGLVALSFSLVFPVLAQDHEVSGRVVDENESPLPGVNIQVKGTNIGTATESDGTYELSVPAPTDTLVFSFIGYQTREIFIEGRSEIDVVMAQKIAGMGEVVVVGYGEQTESSITGSVTSVNVEDTAPLATQRADQLLQGQAAGVSVRNVDAAPGGETLVRIRGQTTILGGNDPLIVVDGVQGRDLKSLNPNDIESIDVLKDAAATAVYGSQGSNGVVLIETKQGETGAPQVSYNGDVTTASAAKKIPLLSAAEYAREINQRELANNVNRDPDPIFTESEIEQFEQNGGTDWQDAVFRRTITHNHQLSISGGTESINYYTSLGYIDQQGILRNSGYDRFNARANITGDITDRLEVGVNWSGSRESSFSPPVGGGVNFPMNPVFGALTFPPTVPKFNDDGTYRQTPEDYGPDVLDNPIAAVREPMNDDKDIKTDIKSYVRLGIISDLSLEVNGSASIERGGVREFFNSKTNEGERSGGGAASRSNRNLQNYQYRNILKYTPVIGRHSFSFTGITELKYTESFSTSINNTGFVNESLGIFDLGGSEIQNTSSSHFERLIQSAMGRLNYDYNSKYLFSASYRADGSSVFGEKNKWGYFPAFSIGWRISEESFVPEFISDLTIRASTGTTGNQAISPYQTLAAISQSGDYPYRGGGGLTRGFRISRAANPSLTWEESTQRNLGVDLSVLQGKLSIESDFYISETDRLLLDREIPTSTGLSTIIDNVGSLETKGVELSINGNTQIAGVEWSGTFNLTRAKTTVVDLGETEEIAFDASGGGQGTTVPFMYLREGKEFGQMFAWGYEGTWNMDEADQAAEYGQLPGDPKYTDVNDDGVIDLEDQKVIGNSQPDFTFGFSNQFAYQGVRFSMHWQGSYGNDIFNISKISRAGAGTCACLRNRWTPDNQDTDVPAIIDGQTREEAGLTRNINFPAGGHNQTARWVEDGSYVRLKNLSVAYVINSKYLQEYGVNTLRVRASGENMITLTDYSGQDPEVSSFTGNDAQLGTDFNNYPLARRITFAINFNF